MEEAQGFHGLLNLEEPKYTIEQIGAKVGKNPAYVASRARLTELIPAAVEAFYAEEIGVGHALLLAKLQSAQQEAALVRIGEEPQGRPSASSSPFGISSIGYSITSYCS